MQNVNDASYGVVVSCSRQHVSPLLLNHRWTWIFFVFFVFFNLSPRLLLTWLTSPITLSVSTNIQKIYPAAEQVNNLLAPATLI